MCKSSAALGTGHELVDTVYVLINIILIICLNMIDVRYTSASLAILNTMNRTVPFILLSLYIRGSSVS